MSQTCEPAQSLPSSVSCQALQSGSIAHGALVPSGTAAGVYADGWTCHAVLCRDDGKISKTLSLQPFGDKGDWYLGLDVKDAANKDNSMKLGLPLTGGELHTIKALSEVMTLLHACQCLDSTANRFRVEHDHICSLPHAGMHGSFVRGHAVWVHALSWVIY